MRAANYRENRLIKKHKIARMIIIGSSLYRKKNGCRVIFIDEKKIHFDGPHVYHGLKKGTTIRRQRQHDERRIIIWIDIG